ncbi:hypothetical protein Scep_003323 [Stephania cephalantha]|uniref:Protein BIC1 n=1 Tax=Stephania cephalantha TaxID=152367 RepID=A0AAP0KSP8_9MAGN
MKREEVQGKGGGGFGGIEVESPSVIKRVIKGDSVEQKISSSSSEKSLQGMAKVAEVSGREKPRRHRIEVAGRVWIPDIWGQEELLKDWIDCSAFDASLVPAGIMSARAALVEEGIRSSSSGLRIENRAWNVLVSLFVDKRE